MTNAFLPHSRAATLNSFWLIIYTGLVIGRALTNVYNLQVSFYSASNMSALLKVKKGIPKTISILVLARFLLNYIR